MRARFLSLTPFLALALLACGDKDTTEDSGAAVDTAPVAAEGDIYIDVQSIDFGEADDINIQSTVDINIENRGVGALQITDLVATPPFTGTLVPPLIIQPQSVYPLVIVYNPDSYTRHEGAITISSDDPDTPEIVITLQGEVIVDSDGDGHWKETAGGDDCDDTHPGIYLGAPEIWYDGVDQDCLGDDDYDQDADGYQSAVFNPDVATGGGDCNDAWGDIHPGAVDDWYDGVDSDCDGTDDWDADEDGYGAALYDKGNDCDDSDAEIHPGATERLNNKIDDCNEDVADIDMLAPGAELHYPGGEFEDMAGYGLALGDLDGDRIEDMIVGIPGANSGAGALSLYLSSDGLPVDGRSVYGSSDYFYGDDTDALGQFAAYLDDFTGDADGDVVIGASGAADGHGMIYVVQGLELISGGDTEDAWLTISGDSTHTGLGIHGAGEVDLNGDGLSDLIFDYKTAAGGTNESNVALLYGGAVSDLTVADMDATWAAAEEPESTDYVEDFPNVRNMSAGYDVDGDGYDDWAYCDPLVDVVEGQSNNGQVWLLTGSGRDYSTDGLDDFSDDAVAVGYGRMDNYFAGWGCGLLPDLNLDGNAELWWYQREDSTLHFRFGGPDITDSNVDATGTDAEIELYTDWAVSQLRAIGDWDGDHMPEIAIGIDGGTMVDEGGLYLYPGAAISGELDYEDDAFGWFTATEDEGSEIFGWNMPHTAGDIDGDGLPDLVTTDPLWDEDIDGDTIIDVDIGGVFISLNGGNW